jgi:hypothetical protein
MKVFLSWSGEDSMRLAELLRDWLPLVIQSVRPWMSTTDIGKGARWSVELGRELDETGYGIICVTPISQTAPWLLFESGALSKRFETSRVSLFLLGMRPSELIGPLAQFQVTQGVREDVWRLIKGLNLACGERGIDEPLLSRTFDREWSELETALQRLGERMAGSAPTKRPRQQGEMLEEVLSRVRSIERQLIPPTVTGVSRGSALTDREVVAHVIEEADRFANSKIIDRIVRRADSTFSVVLAFPVDAEVCVLMERRLLRYHGLEVTFVAPDDGSSDLMSDPSHQGETVAQLLRDGD